MAYILELQSNLIKCWSNAKDWWHNPKDFWGAPRNWWKKQEANLKALELFLRLKEFMNLHGGRSKNRGRFRFSCTIKWLIKRLRAHIRFSSLAIVLKNICNFTQIKGSRVSRLGIY